MTCPDCCLTGDLPQDFETDFRAWVVYDNLAARARTEADEAALLDYAQQVLVHGPLTSGNIDSFLSFYRCGVEEQEREKRSAAVFRDIPRGFDFAVDGPLIWAAFLQVYSIDLRTAQLHWWDFMALFRALPDDCRICKIIEYRTADTSDMPQKTRELYDKLRKVYALPETAGGTARKYVSMDERRASILARQEKYKKEHSGR